MVYKNKFVCSLKVNGQILRESKDGQIESVVHLPYGSEYSLLLKNLEGRTALAKLTIDGQNIFKTEPEGRIIVPANKEIEIKGWTEGLTGKSAFRFIQKTQEIIDHRGDKIDDGMIRCEFTFRKKEEVEELIRRRVIFDYPYWPYVYPFYPPVRIRPLVWYESSFDTIAENVTYGASGTSSGMSNTVPTITSCNANNVDNFKSAPNEDEGITVEGNDISQEFVSESIGELEVNSDTIIICLRGFVSDNKNQPVSKPLTIKTKMSCPSCGGVYKSSFKFCPKCSSRLVMK